ncbi:MAG: hypothetical protein ACHQRM_18105 [Bacteroidia bacterium]
MNILSAKRAAWLALSVTLVISSCKKEEQAVTAPISNEILTTTILNLQNANNAADKPWIRYKLIGSNPAVVTSNNADSTLHLMHNATYNCTIVILDETKTPADTVSKVIKERANIHLFFFRPIPFLTLTDSITDRDTNVPPLPVGLTSVMKAGAISTGNLEVILRHQPNVKNGTYPPGSTDLDVTYPVKIQ